MSILSSGDHHQGRAPVCRTGRRPVQIRWRCPPSDLQYQCTAPPHRRATNKVRLGEEGVVMAWVILVVAGFFETGFAVCALISFGLLTIALRELEVGPAYAVWTGIGATGAATVGMTFLGDTVSAGKLVSIALILAGMVSLNLSGVTP